MYKSPKHVAQKTLREIAHPNISPRGPVLGKCPQIKNKQTNKKTKQKLYSNQEPITWILHMCCTLESTNSRKELVLDQAFPRK